MFVNSPANAGDEKAPSITAKAGTMGGHDMLVVFITLLLAAVFLLTWQRRDRGQAPGDRLPRALKESGKS